MSSKKKHHRPCDRYQSQEKTNRHHISDYLNHSGSSYDDVFGALYSEYGNAAKQMITQFFE